ncbi:PHB depolymerase family esterase [uncultured Paracoccus sp.]|uniref:extracellular catalytic domain type 2 short-chain-length polyhydroxyalkanoate depolymerase n=1 Tax=uncultured Paracoccus sp. TaxID=189685 RepID=UPI00260B6FD3|nr:PHB depolymerase family esterase [uncultured Paracoccus sp.]
MRQVSLLPAILAALLVGAGPSGSHHDDIPDPPPVSVSQQLPTDLNLDAGSVTVSGLSSGGFFAHQFHVAFSETVAGAAVLAGGPYACVDIIRNPFWPFTKLDRSSAAVVACTHSFGNRFWGLRPRPPAAQDARQLIDAAYRAGGIDDPANLADDRVWLFRGELDEVVPAAVADSLADLYSLLGVDGEDLRVERGDPDRPANHGMPVDSFSGESRFAPPDCAAHALPFVIECGYDAAELLLRHLYSEDSLEGAVDPHAAGSLRAFDQTAFFHSSRTAGLSNVGYLYVPDACRSEVCRLHVAFHGCRQNADAQGEDRIHDDFVRDAGYNRWAAANRTVVLYPQATAAAGNPRACWDFWGYSGNGWRTREGVQMRAVAAMIKAMVDG